MSTLDIFLVTGPFVVSVELGDEAPKLTGGGAVWDTIDRPRTYGYTHFASVDLFEQTIDVAIDQYPDGDIEGVIKLIEDRRLPTPRIPDVLRLAGPNVKRADLARILVGIDYGDSDYRDDGRRCRQRMSLNFRQHNAPQLVVHNTSPAAAAAPPAAASTGSAGGTRTYTVVSGDTLSGIAQKLYGSSGRWQALADANGVRDARTLRVGQVLKVPA